jgi:hypothetical protein
VNRDWYLEHFGLDPLFIFDPDDDRNRPRTETPSRYWQAYPGYVRTLFTRAFTVGLRDPDARVMESEWTGALLRLRDAIMTCSACGGTIFFDADDADRPCVRCGVVPDRPRFLAIGRRHRVVLGPVSTIWSDHLGHEQDTTRPVADVSVHPADAARWGLRNLTDEEWTATTPDGNVHPVPPGRTIEALVGTRIHFGPAEAEVVA